MNQLVVSGLSVREWNIVGSIRGVEVERRGSGYVIWFDDVKTTLGELLDALYIQLAGYFGQYVITFGLNRMFDLSVVKEKKQEWANVWEGLNEPVITFSH